MERLTIKLNEVDRRCVKVSTDLCYEHDNCFDCPQYKRMVDRLTAYEDTGLEPEEINERLLKVATLETIESMYDGLGHPDHLRELVQAEQDGRLVVLDSPRLPLIWGDDNRDTVLCPNCKHDLMGGFSAEGNCETHMYQCPYRGQPIDEAKALPREEAETALKTQQGGNA